MEGWPKNDMKSWGGLSGIRGGLGCTQVLGRGVGQGHAGHAMACPVVGTLKLSGHQFLQEKKERERRRKKRKKKKRKKEKRKKRKKKERKKERKIRKKCRQRE